jgi:serine/threonine-protein kinase
MAQVFAARHRNGRPVAVKMMRPELAVEPVLVQRFLREAYAANRVAHPGAVAVHDDDKTDDGVPFLVMDLLEGMTLRDGLVVSGPFDVAKSVRIIVQVLDVLVAAHEKGIVHRDIKPENLFETSSGEVRVLDFGIARLMEATEGMTQSGVTMGTIGYMAPEQARGLAGQVDARSDLWAVGATMFNLLTGRAVHEASSQNEMLLLAMTAQVPPVRSLAPWIPHGLGEVLDKALAFDKEARWPDARAMRDALRCAGDAPLDLAPAQSSNRGRTRPALVLGGGIALALLASFGLVTARAGRIGPAPQVAAAPSLPDIAPPPASTEPMVAPAVGLADFPPEAPLGSADGQPPVAVGRRPVGRAQHASAGSPTAPSATVPPALPGSDPSARAPVNAGATSTANPLRSRI